MTVIGCTLLVTVGRADAAVHVEDNHLRRAAVMHIVDPLPGKIGRRGEIFLGGQIRLEATHLAGRCAAALDRLAADDPPHDRVEAEPVGIVHVVVPAKASENGLAELPDKTVATVLPTTGGRECAVVKSQGHLGNAGAVYRSTRLPGQKRTSYGGPD